MHHLYETRRTFKRPITTSLVNFRAIALAAAVMAALTLSACGEKKEQPSSAATAPKPPEVGVVTISLGNVALVSELPGRLEAYRTAQVRARAAGILQKRLFQEGSDVKAGQQLFQIDSTPYQANKQSALAALAQAEASLAQAAATARRYKPLIEANAISKQDYDAAIATEKAAQAQVAAAKAGVTNANVSLGYATVTAPISGRIGRAMVTEGALVGQGEATQLATIQQVHPLYVNLTQSASEILRLKEALANGQLTRDGNNAAKVRVFMEDGKEYAHTGRMLFTDLSVDESTGQVSVRAELPNPNNLLLPGMYVRVRLEQAQVDSAALVPQQSVTRNEKGNFVMVVADDGSVAPRPIQINGSQGNSWIVTEGLKNGEKVMVDGLIKLGMGATKVTPIPWQPAPNSAPAAASPSPNKSSSAGEANPSAGQ